MHEPAFLIMWVVLVLPSLQGWSRLEKDTGKGKKVITKSWKIFFMKTEWREIFKSDVSFYSSSLLPYFLYMSSSPTHVTVFLSTLPLSSQTCRQMEGLKYKLLGLSFLTQALEGGLPLVFLHSSKVGKAKDSLPPAPTYKGKKILLWVFYLLPAS